MDWIIIALLALILVLQFYWRPRPDRESGQQLDRLLQELQRSFDRMEKNFKEDFRINREEARLVAKDNRDELARSLMEFRESFERAIRSFNELQR